MTTAKPHVYLILILLAALGLRLGCGVILQRRLADNNPRLANARFRFPDSYQFDAYARNLLDQGQYVDQVNRRAWRTPAYSLLLAGLYRVVGRAPWQARIMTNLLDVLNVFLVYCLGSMIFTRRVGLISAGLAAVYPFFIYFCNLVLADTLGITAMLLVTIAFVAARCNHHAHDAHAKPASACGYVLAGLALALAVMVKTAFGLLGIAFVAFVAASEKLSCSGQAGALTSKSSAWRNRGRVVLLVLLGFAVGMGPWWLRNWKVFGRFVPLSTMGGFTLYESNSDQADGGPNNGKSEFPVAWHKAMRELSSHPAPGRAALLELEADRILRTHALCWIYSRPGRFLRLVPTRIYRTWNVVPNWSGARSWYLRIISILSYGPIMLLALFGLYVYRNQWREVYLLMLPGLYIACLHSVFMGSIRYRLPAMGCVLVLAAAGFNRVYFKKTGVSDL